MEYCASSSFDEAEARSILDETEAARLAEFGSPGRKREYLAGRLMAKSMAAGILGVLPREVSVTIGEGGKPGLPGGLALGIAHSGGLAICAVSAPAGAARRSSGIGLDLELIRPRRSLGEIAGEAFSEAEIQGLSGPDTLERFYALWTLKEAWLKRSGAGIAALASAPSFELPRGAAPWSMKAPAGADGESCDFIGFLVETGGGRRYAAALVCDRLAIPPEVVFHERFPPPESGGVRPLCATSRAARLSGL